MPRPKYSYALSLTPLASSPGPQRITLAETGGVTSQPSQQLCIAVFDTTRRPLR
jgi:hypothetical protein